LELLKNIILDITSKIESIPPTVRYSYKKEEKMKIIKETTKQINIIYIINFYIKKR